MRFSKILQVLFIVSIGVFKPAFGADLNDPILGQWKWFTKSTKVFHADGRLTDTEGRITKGGTWRRLNPDEAPGKYEIVWSSGRFVDTILLGDGDNRLSGKNTKGDRVSAVRLSREDPDKTAETPATNAPAIKSPPPSKQIEPFLEPSLNAILAPLGENPQMPRIPVEKLRAALGAGVVTAKTPAQQQIYQCAIAVCDALTNGMDERAQARAAAIQSGLLPSISNGGSIVKTAPLRGWDAGHAGDAIRKKQKDERSYADKQAKGVSNFADSAAYKAWVAKTTILRDNAMGLYSKLVQFEAADSLAEGAR